MKLKWITMVGPNPIQPVSLQEEETRTRITQRDNQMRDSEVAACKPRREASE